MSDKWKIKNLRDGNVYIEVDGRRFFLGPLQEVEVEAESVGESTKLLQRDGFLAITAPDGPVKAPRNATQLEADRKAELEADAKAREEDAAAKAAEAEVDTAVAEVLEEEVVEEQPVKKKGRRRRKQKNKE